MSDIWSQVATALTPAVDEVLWTIRTSPEFVAMGSEIERALAAYFVTSARLQPFPMYLGHEFKITSGHGIFLTPQYEVGPYRVDFVLGSTQHIADLRKHIVIECDGHQFHEKTKEQAARDKKRDRTLTTTFGAVLHFTGSEIYRDVAGCWSESLRALAKVAFPDKAATE